MSFSNINGLYVHYLDYDVANILELNVVMGKAIIDSGMITSTI